jgi:hypothetical protein
MESNELTILSNLQFINSRIKKLSEGKFKPANKIEITIKYKNKKLETLEITNINLAYDAIKYLINLLIKYDSLREEFKDRNFF